MLRGLKISLMDLQVKNVQFNRGSRVTIDNLIGLAVLRRDAALGQCVSYFRIMIDFRQDQGYSFKDIDLTDRNTGETVFLVISQSRSP